MLRTVPAALVVLAASVIVGCSAGSPAVSDNSRGGSASGGVSGGSASAGAGVGGAHAGGASGGSAGMLGGSGAGGGSSGGSSATGGGAGLPAGGSSGTGGGSAGTGAVGCAGLPLCDDFEGVAAGAAPDPSKWTPTVLADCMSSAPKPMVDGSQHHSGTRSLKVAGTATFCDYAMVGNSTAFKAIGNVVYGRYYVRFETALDIGHAAFMIFPDAMSGHALRMGSQNSALQWNRQADDATLPAQSPVGIGLSKVPPVGGWMCVEFMLDQAQGLISTWVDSNLVTGLVADATPTPDVDSAWGTTYRPTLTGFNLGWQNYGAGAMTLWFDDVALSATRITCN